VLVRVRLGGLLDAAGEEEIGPVVLEARGGGHRAQKLPFTPRVPALLEELPPGRGLRFLALFDEARGQAELHPLQRRAVLADEDYLSFAREREDYGGVGTLDDVVGVFYRAVGEAEAVGAEDEVGGLEEPLAAEALPGSAVSQRRPRRWPLLRRVYGAGPW
jgi:hypothetical protein